LPTERVDVNETQTKRLVKLAKIYQLARQIHTTMVLVILALGLAMTITGLILKFPAILGQVSTQTHLNIRSLHNFLSPYFSLVLMIMLLTGLIMYLYPKITTWLKNRWQNQNSK